MCIATSKIRTWNESRKGRKERPDDIYLIADLIPKAIVSTQVYYQIGDSFTYEIAVDYLELLAAFVKETDMSGSIKPFNKRTPIAVVINDYEDLIIGDDIELIECDHLLHEEKAIIITERVWFTSHTLYDFNFNIVNENICENIKVGCCKAMVKILEWADHNVKSKNFIDNLLKYDMEFINEYAEENLELGKRKYSTFKNIVKKEGKKIHAKVLEYNDKDFDFKAVYGNKDEKKIFDCIKAVLEFDLRKIDVHRDEGRFDDDINMESLFLVNFTNAGYELDSFFNMYIESRGEELQHYGQETLFRKYHVTKNKITRSMTIEEEKELDEFQVKLSNLAYYIGTLKTD